MRTTDRGTTSWRRWIRTSGSAGTSLTRTLGHFRDPYVAFVGTPQIYGNMGNLIARGAAQQTYMFYGPILRALSSWRMTLLIGANHIVRVAALREVGWYQWDTWSRTWPPGKRFHLKFSLEEHLRTRGAGRG